MDNLLFDPADLPSIWNEQVWPIVVKNASPPYYLVGGAICRTIINRTYGTNLPIRNYDVAAGSLSSEPA